MDYKDKLTDYLPEFVKEFKSQLDSDQTRWGDTWKKRSIEGQEMRIKNDFMDYFDKFENANEPIQWLKVIGNAYIAWVREQEQRKSGNIPADGRS